MRNPNKQDFSQNEYNQQSQQYNPNNFQQQGPQNQQYNQGYQQQPPKKGLSGWAIGLIIAGVLFLGTVGTFIVLGFFTTAMDVACTDDPYMEGCESYLEENTLESEFKY